MPFAQRDTRRRDVVRESWSIGCSRRRATANAWRQRWLDAARYADTNGYQNDGERIMWRWRDWVIDAFNSNMPFDQFTIEQLAGDMLPKRDAGAKDRHRLQSQPSRQRRRRHHPRGIRRRVRRRSRRYHGHGLARPDVGCARCHDHKFDPITQKEFYQLFAYFNNVPERGKAIKYGNSPPLYQVADARTATEAQRARGRRSAARAHFAMPEPMRRPRSVGERISAAGPQCVGSRKAAPFPLDGDTVVRRGPKVRDASGRRTAGPLAGVRRQALLDAGDVGDFGFFDKFSLAAWILSAGPRRHHPVAHGRCRSGRGLQSRSERRQDPCPPRESLARRRHSRRDRATACSRIAGTMSWSPTTARAWPPASRFISMASSRS